uniref:DUF3074 domain-containing protein n=1 Tax=Prymnesium polylepis TaxID=72548 RepID=A0A7S4HEC3_9EUKA|mmetsp:Transcript_13713/g.35049  ORF Transcript_13713/g.35049 Transcript_13713/m.35049 type:complete len:217 (+) Transcript_13713:3-653(+)
MLLPLSLTVQHPTVLTAHAASRSTTVLCRGCTFEAGRKVVSSPFALSASVSEWFAEDEALRILLSAADSATPKGDGLWEISTSLPFPGAIMRSVNVMRVERPTSESFSLSVVDAKTTVDSGPEWVAKLMEAIDSTSKTVSTNRVTVERHGADSAVAVSDIKLSVTMKLPGWLLLPVGPMERAGSQSLQGVLDQQIAPVLERWRKGYLAWAASKTST